MSLNNYGVLKGKAIDSMAGHGTSPHYQVQLRANDVDFRIAINVKSKLSPSELLFLVDDRFQHPILDSLTRYDEGFTKILSNPGGIALDFIRANLFDHNNMLPLAHNIPGPDNDLNEKIGHYIKRAIASSNAMVYAFGQRWGPENDKNDKYFGFLPGNGIHDIHMNQGNVGTFISDDGVWQDGGLLIHYPDQNQWVGVFLAFQSQSWHTDDITGHSIIPIHPEAPVTASEGLVKIVAALVNPPGDDAGKETITLLNLSPDILDLNGWSIVDKNERKEQLTNLILAPGAATAVVLSGGTSQLSNKGGIISLLDQNGIKIDGVSYTKAQVSRQGWSITF
ncbi:DUF2278 family protein [Desulforhopalus sp. IMCC35007]|uniref:DUF2278 family protein n=1 Tax=Desulforhopalus sp. IMCC35007 TaxID=2569543 RepID=UPI0010ADB5C9|nr:DUF2278 family protein [Desulforhopalus sp. IMCC35007]TKB06684.1 DUF2278 family protein [Desulforhopalus sp. IMCC35007]